MVKMMLVLGSTALGSLLLYQNGRAEVVDVDVTITSVDAKARNITIVHETNARRRAVDLDVSRKAEITVNGRPGTLGSLQPGQKASISYEKEFQIVTKIAAVGGTAVAREVYRLTLHISDFGDSRVRLEKTSQPAADDFSGTPFKLSNWPRTKVTKGRDGIFRLVHDFRDSDELDALALQKYHLTMDQSLGALVFTPGPMPESYSVQRAAWFIYFKKVRLPLTVICDLDRHSAGSFVIRVSDIAGKLGALQYLVHSEQEDVDDPSIMRVSWYEPGADEQQGTTTLYDSNIATLDRPLDQKLRLPVPNAKIDGPFLLELIKTYGDGVTTLSRLEVRSRLVPTFGVELGEKEQKVFVKKLFPGGMAAKLGLQVGDVFLAVNGKKPQTIAEGVDLISNLPVGEEAVLTVQRGEKMRDFRLVAE